MSLTIYFVLHTFLLEHELIYELIQVGRWPPRPVLPTLEMDNKNM